jgi:spore photoproduct lyase
MSVDEYGLKFQKSCEGTFFKRLSSHEQTFLRQKAFEHRLSHQEIKQLVDMAIDLRMWGKGSLAEYWDETAYVKRTPKQKKQAILQDLRRKYALFQQEANDYSELPKEKIKAPKIKLESEPKESLGFGLCPVASPKTRCCNLLTLDAVESCGFDCSYCSIQSFYNEGKITFDATLKEKLEEIELDPNEFYHIGTGQASDSLMWGNRFGVLDDLLAFAKKHPNVMLEFKTKSDNVSYFLDKELPANLLFTWSLNPQTIIDNEEHLTASLQQRIVAAEKMAQKGALVGFHFHPIIWYKNWKEEYGEVFDELLKRFDPKQVVLVSFGTLTFIKPVMQKIRRRDFKSKILQMPLSEAAGKLSYPLEMKKEMFRFAYEAFAPWHKDVFFYLCMEDHSLWKDVFGYEYPTNESFELDMKLSYMAKISAIKKG